MNIPPTANPEIAEPDYVEIVRDWYDSLPEHRNGWSEMTVTNREVVALLHDLLTQAKLNEARTKNPMVSELTLARAAYGGSLEKIRTLHKAEILEILAEIEQANWDNYVIGCINKIDEIRNRLNKK